MLENKRPKSNSIPTLSRDARVGQTFQKDRDPWGWVVCGASFFAYGIACSIMNTYGVILSHLVDTFQSQKHSRFLLSLPGSVCTALLYFCSPLTAGMVRRFGVQRVTLAGSVLATVGMFASSYSVKGVNLNVKWMTGTFGVLVGLGLSLVQGPALVILTHYFDAKLGVVNGIVTTGSSAFTILLTTVLPFSLKYYGLNTSLKLLSFLIALLVFCSVAFVDKSHRSPSCGITKRKSPATILRKRSFILWALGLCIVEFGHCVPYVHLIAFTSERFPHSNPQVTMTLVAASSLFGRITFGTLSDSKRISRVALHQIAYAAFGVTLLLFPFVTSHATVLIVCVVYGLFDGAFYGLVGPIAVDLVGAEFAADAIGFILFVFGAPVALGPSLAALLFDNFQTYNVAFIIAAVPCFLGAVLVLPIVCGQKDSPTKLPREVELINVKL